MSTSTEGLFVPEWDLADRLTKSLRVAKMSVQEMADYLDVHRNSVGAWMNGRTPPTTQTLRLWAMRTGVPFEWLKTGAGEHHGPSDDGGGAVSSGPTSGKSSCFNSSGRNGRLRVHPGLAVA